jgi:hypothetical protein
VHDAFRRFVILLGARRPFMTGISYENLWLFRTLTDLGFERIEFLVFAIPGNRCYVFATRSNRMRRNSESIGRVAHSEK